MWNTQEIYVILGCRGGQLKLEILSQKKQKKSSVYMFIFMFRYFVHKGFFFFFFMWVMEIKLKASHMLGKFFSTELPHPRFIDLFIN